MPIQSKRYLNPILPARVRCGMLLEAPLLRTADGTASLVRAAAVEMRKSKEKARELPDPIPGPNQVVVRVCASGQILLTQRFAGVRQRMPNSRFAQCSDLTWRELLKR